MTAETIIPAPVGSLLCPMTPREDGEYRMWVAAGAWAATEARYADAATVTTGPGRVSVLREGILAVATLTGGRHAAGPIVVAAPLQDWAGAHVHESPASDDSVAAIIDAYQDATIDALLSAVMADVD